VRIFSRILAAVVIAAFAVGPVSAATAPNASPIIVAQGASTTQGTINGTVKDETGAPISGATIVVRGPATYQTTSDAKGNFTLASVSAGVYLITAQKAGYVLGTSSDFPVVAGEAATLTITLQAASFNSLQTIATVHSAARGTFNTSTASVNVVSAQTFKDQAQVQVDRILNQIPGVQANLGSDDANGAAPGANTFIQVRGALSYETAVLVDGHPLASASFGDVLSNYFNSYTFSNVEVIKGPGAMAPEVNGAIGGTVNFQTKDPTLTATPSIDIGYTSHGGSFYNFGLSDTLGRLGFVVDIAGLSDPSELDGQKLFYDPTQNGAIVGTNIGAGQGFALNPGPGPLQAPGTANNQVNRSYSVVACCYTVSGDDENTAELLKLRYRFSNATTATIAYLGSQTTSDDNGNNSTLNPGLFQPGASYTGSLPANDHLLVSNIFPGSADTLNDNEPIFEGELRSTLGNDTLLGRFYHASLIRLITQGAGLNTPTEITANLFGVATSGVTGQPITYNGTPTPVFYYDFFLENESDKLSGYSFEYDHPFSATNNLTFSVDTHSTDSVDTEVFSNGNEAFGVTPFQPNQTAFNETSLPDGSSQTDVTYLLRDQATLSDRFAATLSLYANTYSDTYAASAVPGTGGADQPANSPNFLFTTTNTGHFDQRLGLTYRVSPNQIVRLAAGSAIAPPYLDILSVINGTASYSATNNVVSQTLNGGNLRPETAAEIDLGTDIRLPKQSIYVSGDIYQTNLFNHFVNEITNAGTCAQNSVGINCAPFNGNGAQATTPVDITQEINLSNSRFQGLELAIKRITPTGLDFSLSGALQHAYAYNLPKCFYGAKNGVCGFYTNLGIVPGQNFSDPVTTGEATGFGYNGFGSGAIPYLTGNAEISYTTSKGIFASIGTTLYGKNNSYNENPFFLSYATLRVPLTPTVSFQVSGDNIFNQLNSLFPITGGGVNAPLAGSPVVGGVTLPATALTTGNVLGPATYRFVLTTTFGQGGSGNNYSNGRNARSAATQYGSSQ
jgi:hypothetical protein